jgi:hypothetical protein
MRRSSWLAIILLAGASAHAQPDFPTNLEDCTGENATFCFTGTPVLVDSSCGARFENYQGRIAWPPLRNVGPVVIAVQARHSFEFQTFYPLYVQVRARGPNHPPICEDGLSARVVLAARGADQCGGTWESIGPIDLENYGVPLGSLYSVQAIFFRTTPDQVTVRTVGFSCIRVTAMPTLGVSVPWSSVKILYR